MKITAFHIDGFGVYHDQTLRDVGPGLTVFQGMNEAGKSTLLAFLRAIPYGFEPKRDSPLRYEPLAGGNHGGWMEFGTRVGGTYRLERRPGKTLPGEGRLFDLKTNEQLGPDELDRLLGAPRETFYNVYAFSIGELQGLESLTTQQVRNRIWSAGMGHAAVSIADVESEFRKRRDALYSPRGSARDINQTIGRLKAARTALREAEARREEYERKSAELDELRAQAEELAAERARLESRLRRLEQYQRAWDVWVRLQADREEEAEGERVEEFPPDGLARIEELGAKREDLGKQVSQSRDRIATRTKQRDDLPIDACLLDNRAAVDALAQKVSKLESSVRDLPVREQEARTEEEQLAQDLRELAPDRDEEWLKRVDVSTPVTNAAREQGERLRRVEDAASACQQETARARKAVQSAEAQRTQATEALGRMPEPPVRDAEELRRRQEALAGARQALADVQSAADEQRHLGERREDLQRQMTAASRTREQATARPADWSIPLVALIIGVTVAVLTRSVTGVIVGATLAGILVALWARLKTAQRQAREATAGIAADELRQIEEAFEETQRRLAKTEARRADAEARLAACAGGLAAEVRTQADVEAAARTLEAAREQLAQRRAAEDAVKVAEQAVTAATGGLAEAEEALANAQEALAAERSGWRAWLEQRDLSPDLSPAGFNELTQGVRRLREGLKNLDQTRGRAEGIARDIEAITEQAAAVFEACGRTLPQQQALPAAIVSLATELQDSVRHQATAEGIERELGDLRDDLRRTEDALAETDREFEELIRRAGAQDLEDFRRKGERHAQQEELAERISEGETQLEIIAGVGEERRRLETELAELTPEEIGVQQDETQRQRGQTNEDLNRVNQDLGAWRQEIAELEASEEIAACLQEQSNETARLTEQIEEYGTLTAALLLLRKARQKYEEERQPLVIREAGECMERVTGGRYVDVVSPLGEPDELRLKDREGNQKGIDQLSGGTQQQLYLAMRLAYVTVHHASATTEPLPLIMDEVLVNFDPVRAKLTAELIAETARDNQVFLFTCHPETVEVFRALEASVRVVAIEGGAIGGQQDNGDGGRLG